MAADRMRREYRGQACHRCHQQKVKCSRETPCRNCAVAKRPCTYAVRDRKVTVQESYLKNLEAALAESGAPARASQRPAHGSRQHSHVVTQGQPQRDPVTSPALPRRPCEPLVENSTTELFVSRLKQIQKSNPASGQFGSQQESLTSTEGEHSGSATKSPPYEYFALNFDTLHAKTSFKLPPYPYAVHILEQFTIYFAEDWHFFLVEQFRRRVDKTYLDPNSVESKDRIWLCQLLLVFALGLSINGHDEQPSFRLEGDVPQTIGSGTTPSSSPPPGMEYFEQALMLLKVPYEEVSVGHIETVNLVALYSYSLNRQKTMYMYAGLSTRMCNMLQLHKSSASIDCPPLEREHRKRLWWSTFCIDRMASTQMGLLPSLQIDQTDLEYPSQTGLSTTDAAEFKDPSYLTARVQLTIIQTDLANQTYDLGRDDSTDIETIFRPMLQRLDVWRTALPALMALGMEDGVPASMRKMPYMRSLANFHLRFNHCVILLLRPLLLRQIACIFSGEESNASPEDLGHLNDILIRSARANLRLLIDIRACGLLVRLGFMENVHLSSSLMILCLAMSVNVKRPRSFRQRPDDLTTYEAGKDVLRDMIRAGSLAARGHEKILVDVESLGRCIATDDAAGADAAMVEQWDIDEWMTQLFEVENMPEPSRTMDTNL